MLPFFKLFFVLWLNKPLLAQIMKRSSWFELNIGLSAVWLGMSLTANRQGFCPGKYVKAWCAVFFSVPHSQKKKNCEDDFIRSILTYEGVS